MMRPKLSTGSVPGVFYIGMEVEVWSKGQLVDFFDMIPDSVALQLSLQEAFSVGSVGSASRLEKSQEVVL